MSQAFLSRECSHFGYKGSLCNPTAFLCEVAEVAAVKGKLSAISNILAKNGIVYLNYKINDQHSHSIEIWPKKDIKDIFSSFVNSFLILDQPNNSTVEIIRYWDPEDNLIKTLSGECYIDPD